SRSAVIANGPSRPRSSSDFALFRGCPDQVRARRYGIGTRCHVVHIHGSRSARRALHLCYKGVGGLIAGEMTMRNRSISAAFAGLLLLGGCPGGTLDAVFPGDLGPRPPPAVHLPPQDAGMELL